MNLKILISLFYVSLVSFNVNAQDAVILVYISGKVYSAPEYVNISSNSFDQGVIGINEYLLIEASNGQYVDLEFSRRGLKPKTYSLNVYDEITIINVDLNNHISHIKMVSKSDVSFEIIEICKNHLHTNINHKNSLCKIVGNTGQLPALGSSVFILNPTFDNNCNQSEIQIIQSIFQSQISIKYDLVDRDNFTSIIEEQKLSLSGLVEEEDNKIEVGNIKSAEYLISTDYKKYNEIIYCTINFIEINSSLKIHTSVISFTSIDDIQECIKNIYLN